MDLWATGEEHPGQSIVFSFSLSKTDGVLVGILPQAFFS